MYVVAPPPLTSGQVPLFPVFPVLFRDMLERTPPLQAKASRVCRCRCCSVNVISLLTSRAKSMFILRYRQKVKELGTAPTLPIYSLLPLPLPRKLTWVIFKYFSVPKAPMVSLRIRLATFLGSLVG